jgi:hypothetical protein
MDEGTVEKANHAQERGSTYHMYFLRVLSIFLKQADSKLYDAVSLRYLLGACVSIRGRRVLDKEIRLTMRWW